MADTAAMLEQMTHEEQSPLTRTTRSLRLAEQHSLMAGQLQELATLHTEVRTEFAQTRARLAALGLSGKIKDWDALLAKVEQRFDRTGQALEAVDKSTTSNQRQAALTQAQTVLHELSSDAAEQAHNLAIPGPTFSAEPPLKPTPQPQSNSVPIYLSSAQENASPYANRAPGNLYASLDDSLLLAALAPPTPTQAAVCSYTPADLAADGHEVQLTPEIRALAEQLGYSPARIFQYVSSTIKFEPYYGSLKGAVGTLYSQAGGATDQASLLIALLRASNIPARYVKGMIRVSDTAPLEQNARAPRWIGAKTYKGAANILGQNRNPNASYLINASSQGIALTLLHVWVEACVPYSNYRGASTDPSGHRWIPLDPSFKDQTYQPGITIPIQTTNFDFDYNGFLARRSNTLPVEYYEQQVNSYIKTVAPGLSNNTLLDVAYLGIQTPHALDILPTTLPYEVLSFTPWDNNTGPAEIAALPDSHRYKFTVQVNSNAPVTLALPDVVLKRITLSFKPVPADQSLFDAWKNDGNPDSTPPCNTVDVIPVIKLEGVDQAVGTQPTNICNTANQMSLELRLPDLGGNSLVNVANYNNIGSANYHALQAYGFQASNRLLTERAAKLLSSVQSTANPNTNLEETEGEFLHLVGLKYMRHITDASKRIGQLNGGSGDSGNHLGLTSSAMKVKYLFDLPFAVSRQGFLVDVLGGQSRDVDLISGGLVYKTFLLSGYSSSSYEAYIWQENASIDAVSTVRGLQFARETGIPLLTITAANQATEIPKLTNNTDPAFNYFPSQVARIQSRVNAGYTVTAPQRLIQYQNWKGAVFVEALNQSLSGGGAAAGFIISGNYVTAGGGYTVGPEILGNADDFAGISAGTGPYDTFEGDPVNMATGNVYHSERDIAIKGRGLPLVFERAYNSRTPTAGSGLPLGFGWTHSFNHLLSFRDANLSGASDNLTSAVDWIDGTGAEKLIQVSSGASAGGVAVGSVFQPPAGSFFQFSRQSNGTYTLREKNGLTYTFESVAGTINQTARLLSITDRNNNTLTLSYDSVTRDLMQVRDGLGHTLTFTYTSHRLIQVQDWTGRIHQYGYDASGNLSSYRNPLAAAGSQAPVLYSYYSSPQLNHALKSYTLPRGNGMNFEYYLTGRAFRQSVFHDASQALTAETTSFAYNPFRQETQSTNARGYTRRFQFDTNGNPLRIVDETGAERTYTYDPARPYNRLSKTDPVGLSTQYAYDALGNVTQITNPSGSTVLFSNFTAFNAPGKVKDARGNYTLYQYDARGNLTGTFVLKSGIGATITNPAAYVPVASQLLAWSTASYDSYGNVLTRKQVRDLASGVGPILTYNYTDTVNGSVGLNAVSITRQGDKDGNGSLDAADTFSLTYDNLGRVKTGLRADRYPTWFSYDLVDRITQASDDFGQLRDYTFDKNGNPSGQSLTVASQRLDQSSTGFDLSDRRQTTTDNAGNSSAFEYDTTGNLIQVTNPDHYTVSFDYDPNNALIKAFDAEHNAVSRQLDASGRITTLTDPNGSVTSYVYYDRSRNGRLQRQVDPAGHVLRYDYDANGNVIFQNDTLLNTTLTAYDELNRPTRVTGPIFTDSSASLGNIRPLTLYSYSPLGDLLQVSNGYTDASGTNPASDHVSVQHRYTYDDFGQRLSEADALNRLTRYTYDLYGNVASRLDAKNQTTSYAWDYGHRLRLRTSPGTVADYTRNNLGQALTARAGEVTTTYTYDTAHRVQTVTDSRGPKTLRYAYSPGGLLHSLIDGQGGETDYLYDAVGRLNTLWAPDNDLIAFVYDAGGRLTQKGYSNGVSSQYAYTADNSLSLLQNFNSDNSLISQHNYAYDAIGRRAGQRDQIGSVVANYSFTYDNVSRLLQVNNANAPTQNQSYSYDPLNNRTRLSLATSPTPTVTSYLYDAAQQLTETRQGSQTGPLLSASVYDPNGSLSKQCQGSGITHTLSPSPDCSGSQMNGYTYSSLDQLSLYSTGSTLPLTPIESYGYDTQGRRIRKTQGPSVFYLYDGQNIQADYQTTWTATLSRYSYGPGIDQPLIRHSGSGATSVSQYYQQDGLGSVVALSNSLNSTVISQSFDAYGKPLTSTGAIPTYGYTGREPDKSGLVYYRARYYDPTVGRFTQTDPIGLQGGVNPYAYVNNSPVNFTDPTGLFPQEPQVQFSDTGSYFSSDELLPGSSAGGLGSLSDGGQSLAGGTVYYGPGVDIACGPGCAALAIAAPEVVLPAIAAVMVIHGMQNSGDGGYTAQGPVFNETDDRSGIDSANSGLGNEEDMPSLLDPQAEQHVLDGDGPNKGGGHRFGTGKSNKSEFPSGWSDTKITGAISDVATDPSSTRTPGGGGRTVVQGTRDGIDITVIVEGSGRGNRIVTGFPTNTPRNP